MIHISNHPKPGISIAKLIRKQRLAFHTTPIVNYEMLSKTIINPKLHHNEYRDIGP